ncbi:MAG: hypothetical protein IKL04_08975 [Lachnospiraceae bacterium]|nr:hypothetical protein [Lachnospiraceae bacterium]
MKKRKFLLLVLLVIFAYGVLLNSGLIEQKASSDSQTRNFVLREEGQISNIEWNNNLSDEQLVVWNDESNVPMLDEEIFGAAESTQSDENRQTIGKDILEEATASETISPSKTPEKGNSSSVQPDKTPESASGTKTNTTLESKPDVKPGTTPENKPSVEPSVPETTPEVSIPSEAPQKELVRQGEYDQRVIPDKFNTGCKNVGSLMKINEAMVVDGVEYSMGDNGNTVVIDLQYRNQSIADDVVIRNVDFSGKKFAIRHSPQTAKRFTFENCKFDEANTTVGRDLTSVIFKSCSFIRFYGSNSTFYNCSFGGSVTDGMNPFSDVHVYNSYFSNFDHDNPSGTHSDAIQIYGKEGIDAENISFHNCRVEIPIIDGGRNNHINACFMVQLEYSNAKNISFENCIISGGGYSIYAWEKNKGWSLQNVKFSNVVIGNSRKFGNIYPSVAGGVTFDRVRDADTIFVASVWKDGAGKVHLSTTNNTDRDRHLVVETEGGRQEFYLPCKKTQEQNYRSSHGRAPYFNELSIDVEVVPDAVNPGWVICYDKCAGAEKQIRFVNWTGGDVYH